MLLVAKPLIRCSVVVVAKTQCKEIVASLALLNSTNAVYVYEVKNYWGIKQKSLRVSSGEIIRLRSSDYDHQIKIIRLRSSD